MTNEELNTKLYEKLFAEQEDFKGWLVKQPPEEILHYSYEYFIRESIIIAMDFISLTDADAKALLADEKPLQSIYNIYEDLEGIRMDEIRDCIESRAKTCVEERREALRNLPVYFFSENYAKNNGELDKYQASFRANVDCKNAIEEAIESHYSDNRLDVACVKDVVERFGAVRVSYVLANTVQYKDWDGRISAENKQWAKTKPIPNDYDDWGEKKTQEYCCNKVHSGLINLFVNRFRKEQELETKKKMSVLKKLHEAKTDTPAKAHTKKKEVEL